MMKIRTMKTKILITLLIIFSATACLHAQRVQVRLDFPVTIRKAPPVWAPYGATVWVGPEWRWERGRYIAVPGYWARPYRHHSVWVPGHWLHGRRGYHWVPGHWR
ncbi:MAG: hypothetical protein GC171_02020 [Terrimonas sp.]|nr:hypothetical protein [Terrimonas sp.]